MAAYSEFEHFEELLARDGVDAKIVDLSDLRYRAEYKELTDNEGRPIDAVYKRILWQDAVDVGKGGLNDPLCQAYLDDAVYVMNSFRSRLVGSKLNMAIAKAQSFEENCAKIGLELTPLEIATLRDCIPETFLWGPDSLDDRAAEELRDWVLSDTANWVLKGFHGKGGAEIIDGAKPETEHGEFRGAWSSQDRSYIAQRLQSHGSAEIPIVDRQRHREIAWNRYPYILGAYVIDGKCVAIEAKTDEDTPINIIRGALRMPVFSLKE